MKKLLSIAALSLAVSAPAMASWHISQSNGFYVLSADGKSMAAHNTDSDSIAFMTKLGDHSCKDGEHNINFVDGKPVWFTSEVWGGNCYYLATSQKGRDFIHNEFSVKNFVVWNGIKFSAMNYSYVHDEAKKNKENAI